MNTTKIAERQISEAAATLPKVGAKHFTALDGLRGIAILGVFVSHLGGGHESKNFLIHIWSLVADAGWMGVDLFFCLSGFLITGILYDTRHAEKRVRNFYARRTLRIFPIYYGVLLGLLLLTPILHLHWKAGHLLYVLYLGNLTPILAPHTGWPGQYVGFDHFWSLAVEEQFYLIWPFVVWLVMDRRKLLRVCLGVIAAVLVTRTTMMLRGTDSNLLYTLLWTRADSLMCGAALALYMRAPGAPRLPMNWLLPTSALGTALLFLAAGNTLHDTPIICSVGFTVIAVFSTCLVYCATVGNHWIAWVGNLSILRFFGRYSYGLYVYHGLLVVALLPLARPVQRFLHSYFWGGVVFVLGALALSLAMAMVSYHYFEKPILGLKRRFA